MRAASPILLCSVFRYPFFGPLRGQLSLTTQVAPEVAHAVHCGVALSHPILFRRHSSHWSSEGQSQPLLEGSRSPLTAMPDCCRRGCADMATLVKVWIRVERRTPEE